VHNFGTCVWRTTTQWRLLEKKRVSTQEKSQCVIAAGPRSQSSLHFDIRNIQQIRPEKQFPIARRLLSAALLERWPHVCRVKIMFTKLPTNLFVSTTKLSMKCAVNWIPLRIRVRSRNTQPHLKALSNGAIRNLNFQVSGRTSGNYACIYMSDKNAFICH